jgi:3',5'-cyclic AMP phosphodiesterase CpdA
VSERLVLGHASDLHIRGRWSWAPWRYFPKRITGAASYGIRRLPQHPPAVARALVSALASDESGLDHVVLTGDLTNLSFETEFVDARTVLAPILSRRDYTSAIPGNHDRYTYGSARKRLFEGVFGDLAASDGEQAPKYPWVRFRKGVAIIGLDSAIPTLPFFACGRLGKEQLAAFEKVLASERVRDARFRVVLVHHAPLRKDGRRDTWLHGLRDDQQLLVACGRGRVGLLLHGHIHAPYRHEVEREGWKLTIVNSGSSTRLHRSPALVGGYNVYVIEGDRLASIETRTYRPESDRFDGRRA